MISAFDTIFLLLPLSIIMLHTLSLIVPRVMKILLCWLSFSNFGTNKMFCTLQFSSLLHPPLTPKILYHPCHQYHSPLPRQLHPLPNLNFLDDSHSILHTLSQYRLCIRIILLFRWLLLPSLLLCWLLHLLLAHVFYLFSTLALLGLFCTLVNCR